MPHHARTHNTDDSCLDPVLSIVSLLSAKNPFVLPLGPCVNGCWVEREGLWLLTSGFQSSSAEKKDAANRAKLHLAGDDASDHKVGHACIMHGWIHGAARHPLHLISASVDVGNIQALLSAYERWKEAERQGQGRDFCWHHFLSSSTLRMVVHLRD